MIEVLRQVKGISHAAKLVLLAITAYVAEHGQEAFPSQVTLAKDAGITERYIEDCVQECEQAGYLAVRRRRDPGTRPRNFYTVLFPWRHTAPAIPEQPSGNLLQGTQFSEAPAIEKQEEKDLQKQPIPRTPIPEPAPLKSEQGLSQVTADDPALQRGMRMLPEGGALYQEVQAQLTPPPAKPTRTRPRNRGARSLTLVTERHYVGKLCPQGHRWQEQDQSLRRRPGGSCVVCDRLRQRKQG